MADVRRGVRSFHGSDFLVLKGVGVEESICSL